MRAGLLLIALVTASALTVTGCDQSKDHALRAAVGQSSGTAIPVQYAKTFTTEQRGHFVVVRLTAPIRSWTASGEPQVQSMSVVLAPKDGPAPILPADLAGAVVVRTPVQRIAVNMGTQDAILTTLGVADRLVAVGGEKSYDDSIRRRVANKELGQLGYAWHGTPNLDVLVASAPDVFVMNLINLDHSRSLTRANQLGIPTIPSFIDSETDILARAEWVKFYGLLVGREKEALTWFADVEKHVLELRALASKVKPVPMIWAYSGGGDRFEAVVRPPEGQYITDAGGINLLQRPADSTQPAIADLSTEDVITRGAHAQCWIAGDIHAEKPPPVTVLSAVDAYKEHCIFANTGRSKPDVSGYDWYDNGEIRPDLILADFVAMLHPDLLPGHRFEFLERIDGIEAGRAH